jgi:glutathione peroxidase
LGFPCNQFGGQEPGSEDEISSFCTLNYGVTFQIMEKIDVNGPNAHPLYEWMKNEKKQLMMTRIKWNFEVSIHLS